MSSWAVEPIEDPPPWRGYAEVPWVEALQGALERTPRVFTGPGWQMCGTVVALSWAGGALAEVTLELESATVKPNSTGVVVLEPGATLGGHR